MRRREFIHSMAVLPPLFWKSRSRRDVGTMRPDKDCDVACLGWPDLHRHVKSKHGKVMCDLCTRNKKVFTHEHELFTFGELLDR